MGTITGKLESVDWINRNVDHRMGKIPSHISAEKILHVANKLGFRPQIRNEFREK